MGNVGRGRAANGRSSIYQDKSGRWHGDVSMGHGWEGRSVRRHVSAKTQSEVTRKVRALEKERDSGSGALPGRRPVVSTYLSLWIDRREGLDVRPKTVAGYRTDLSYVEAAIGDVRLDRVTSAHVEHLWTYMTGKGLLPSVSHVRRTLKRVSDRRGQRGSSLSQSRRGCAYAEIRLTRDRAVHHR